VFKGLNPPFQVWHSVCYCFGEEEINQGDIMADRIIEEHIYHTSDGGSSGAFGALAVVLIVLALLVILYFTGAFGRIFGPKKTQIDINVKTPGIVLPVHSLPTLIH
jgi:hypothetical protein